jgi:hypothetical protein
MVYFEQADGFLSWRNNHSLHRKFIEINSNKLGGEGEAPEKGMKMFFFRLSLLNHSNSSLGEID